MTTPSIPRPQQRIRQIPRACVLGEGRTEQARQLCQEAANRFGVVMGRVHEKPVGPHPHWSCQLAFDSAQFDKLISWLDEHRGGLNVLVHPSTGNSLEDHTRNASWLGEPSKLNTEMFEGRSR